MKLSCTIKMANGSTSTFEADFTQLPAQSQASLAAYGFARKINDTANSAAARVRDEGGDESAAKLAAATACHAALLAGTIGISVARSPASQWQIAARKYVRTQFPKAAAAIKGLAPADANRILDATIAKNDAILRPIIDNIIAAQATTIDIEL